MIPRSAYRLVLPHVPIGTLATGSSDRSRGERRALTLARWLHIGLLMKTMMTMTKMNTLKVGDRIRSADAGCDNESGRVVAIDGDMVEVAWESGVRTWTPALGLERE